MKRILGGCLLVLVCAGCIRRVDEKTTITWWQFWTDSRARPVIEDLVTTFERANPNIDVNVVDLTWSEGHQKIVVAFATGTTPDVLELGSDWVAEFASQGLLLDLTAEAERQRSQFAMWSPVTYEGRIYGYPWLLGTRVLFYNKDLMHKAGIDTTRPPETWTEWKAQAQAINALGKDVHGFAANTFERHRLYKKFLPLFWSAGGELFTDGDCTLDSKAGVEALTFYTDLCKVGLFDVQRELDLAFQRGKIGFTISGDWLLAQLRKDPRAPRFGVALIPHPDSGPSISFAGGEYLVVPKKSVRAQEAQLFIDFLLRPENNLKLCRAIGFVPAHMAAAQNAYFTDDPYLSVFNRQLESSRPTPVHPRWVEIEEVIESAVERAMYGGSSPDSALERACADIDNLLSKPMKARRSRRDLWLVLPWAASFALFWLFPLCFALYLAFTSYSPLSGDLSFTGAGNFAKLWSDGDFWQAARNTVVFVVGTVPLTTALALGLALLLNSRIRGKGFFRAAFFFPSITALVVVSLVWTALYARDGVLAALVSAVGFTPPEHGFLLSTGTALPAIMILDIWAAVGYYMLLYLAALQALPAEYFESARLLAATPWQTLRYVIWPALRPMTLLVLVLNTIKSFQIFVEVYVMTRGGPLGSTNTLVYFVYDEGLAKFNMGYASAAAFALFVLVAAVTLVLARRLGFGREIAV